MPLWLVNDAVKAYVYPSEYVCQWMLCASIGS